MQICDTLCRLQVVITWRGENWCEREAQQANDECRDNKVFHDNLFFECPLKFISPLAEFWVLHGVY
jgi:hypothetical protein